MGIYEDSGLYCCYKPFMPHLLALLYNYTPFMLYLYPPKVKLYVGLVMLYLFFMCEIRDS